MDYDKNDFQSQNFQLAADDNKFPQSLPRFSLPKFDFDEHLQGNLKFDSLVADTNIILGIQNQNTWIEDFSSGNSAIEFSSSAANTHTSYRHKNVWSEATSSESIEMLLQSVGEDEMNNNKAVAMEAGPQNDSSDLINQVDTTSKKFDDSNCRMENVADADRTMPLDNIEKKLLGQDKDESEVVRKSTESVSFVPTRNEILRKIGVERDSLSFLSNYNAQKECSSFLEPADDSLLLINDGCQVTGISDNHDGLLEKYVVTTNQNEQELGNNEVAKESLADSDRNSKVAFKFTEVENTEGNYSNLDTPTSENETAIVEKCIGDIVKDDEESGSKLIPQKNAVINVSSEILHNSAEAYSHTTLDAYALEKDVAPSVSIDFTNLKNDANALVGKTEGTKNSVDDRSGFGVPSVEDGTNKIQSHLDGSHSKSISCELNDTTSPESQAHDSVFESVEKMKVTADVPSLQVHNFKDAIPADLLLDQNTREVSNQISSVCMKLNETEANISSNSNFTQIEGDTDNRQLEDPDLCLNLKEVSNQISSGCMKIQIHAFKGTVPAYLLQKQNTREVSIPISSECMKLKEIEANISSNIYYTQLECNADNKQLEDPDLCVAKEVINQNSSECMKSKETEANISLDSVFTQLEGNAGNRQLVDPYLCVNVKELSNQMSSECVKSKETDANVSSNSDFTRLESNADNRQLEGSDLCVNAMEVSNQISSECMKSEKAEVYISSNCKFRQLEGNADCIQLKYSDCINEREAPNQKPSVCMKSEETEANMSSNSTFTQLEGYADNRQLEDPELCLNVNDVSNQISSECMQSNETEAGISSNSNFTQPDGNADNRQLEDRDICVNSFLNTTPLTFKGVQSSCHLKSSDTSQCNLQSQLLPDKPITHGDSPVVEEKFVSENEKNMPDKSHISSDDSKQSVFCNSGVLRCHNEENMMSAPSTPTLKLSGKNLLPMETGKTSSVQPSCCSPTIISPGPFRTKLEEKPTMIERVDVSEKDTSNQLKISPGVTFSETPKIPKEIDMGTKEKKSTKPMAKSTKWTSAHKRSSDSVGISCTASSTAFGTGCSVFQLDEVQPKAKRSRKKKIGSPVIQTSCLPDLNSSVSASTLVCRQFSKLQEVHLRAQIFAYGSLIQNIPPREACMQTVFGDEDGARSTWDTLWRKSVDRYQTQKSVLNPETPLLSHSVLRVPEQETKSRSKQSNVTNTSSSTSICKSIAPATPSTPLPLQIPTWNMTSNSPRTAQRNFNQALTPLNPCPSSQTTQLACNNTTWISSNTRPAPWAICTQNPALKSARHSLAPTIDTVKVTTVAESSMPDTLLSSPMPVNIPLDPHGKTASVQKSKKRKNAQKMEDISETILVSQPPPIPVHKNIPTTSTFVPPTTKTHAMVTTEKIDAAVPHNFSHHNYQMINSVSTEIAKVSAEIGNMIQQAKLQAEEADSLAASVVSQSQSIWNQLAAQDNSSLNSEIEAKLVAAAAAGAAATSVARAAVAVAKLASETAVQAKMMANEAIDSAKTEVVFDAGKNLPMLRPESILKGKDKIHDCSLINFSASDPAQIIVEEISATTKRAKNLEAIMKAAELAAEAVSHVGTLIAMGDPLPFNVTDLLEAGPDSFWKAYIKANKLKDLEQSENAPSANKKMQQTVLKDGEHQPVQSEENRDGSGVRKSTLPKESNENDPGNLEEKSFRKGSLVEVIFNEGRLKGGWFSGRVLDVEDNKVHVCYNNLLSDDGSAQLKEWVSLDSEVNGAPRIRIAHPHNVTKNDGTKKRRREVASDYVWEVGDRVDAWMCDGWWEAIITKKNLLDETELTVRFPDSFVSSVVRAWDLRTSLSWKEGRWTEWSRAEEGTLKPHESDTSQWKHQKLDRLETKTNTNNKVDSNTSNTLSKKLYLKNTKIAEEPRPLNISTKDTMFSVWKKESDATKGKRTGPQEEGSGVGFGVPKGHGKKPKFMDVSKHYGSDKSDKYLMPQAVCPWRNTSKTDPKGKQAVDLRSAGVKPFKSLTANSGNAKQKDINTTVSSASYSENSAKNCSEVLFPSRLGSTERFVAPYGSKKKPSSVNEGDLWLKRGLPSSDKSIRSENSEVSEKVVPDANEPRRSNRKIQPTSRLLEGLQSAELYDDSKNSHHLT